MNRTVVSRLLALRRAAPRMSKRNGSGGHHDVVNPGPPITMDYMPVPFQPYKQVYGELQSKFNRYLAISAVLFISSFSLACYTDVFAFEAIRPPQSYRNRK